MTPSKVCLDLIKASEGCILHAYKDSAGVWTIGWGCICYRDGTRVKEGDKVTQAVADDLLAWQVGLKATGVSALLGSYKVNQNQYDALVDFAYNLGIGALEKSTLLKKLKADPADPTIRDEFARWNKAGGKVLDALVKRRKAEADLYFT